MQDSSHARRNAHCWSASHSMCKSLQADPLKSDPTLVPLAVTHTPSLHLLGQAADARSSSPQKKLRVVSSPQVDTRSHAGAAGSVPAMPPAPPIDSSETGAAPPIDSSA